MESVCREREGVCFEIEEVCRDRECVQRLWEGVCVFRERERWKVCAERGKECILK